LHFISFTQECKNRVQLTAEQDGTLFKELVELARVSGNGLPIINFLLAPTSATLKYGYDNHIYLSAPCYVYGQVLSGIELANKTNGLPSTKDWLSVEVRNQSVAVSN
jgi:primosomal replication protein N